ncbi:AfsR/SARP family transcriptional regulator [Plantactinospora endophytica]|uniref:SARP family transcriptional regulator n=1 Tax=Plantactinospora endophytica TaxID=673535 RepID=A0ABQ4DZ45_9ACTN|nr:BTAD domain-containing putative transcriptional regulator [Plantactinospora endophytica]GIG87734.1 SARP family transcriptional regulator [Plantactinospora endophytica]
MNLRYALLGPLVVASDDGHAVPLGSVKQRLLLAALLLRPNEVVGVDDLFSVLWADTPPASAAANLRGYVLGLRRRLDDDGGPSRLPAVTGGYLLRVEPGERDLDRFDAAASRARRALAANDPADAALELGTAVGTWRGALLADLPLPEPLVHVAAQWEERRALAEEDYADALLATGAPDAALPRLRALLDRHPLRQRAWGQLMVALHQTGDVAGAIEAFQRARRMLAEQTGLDPAPALRKIHAEILRHGEISRRGQAPASIGLPGPTPVATAGDRSASGSEMAVHPGTPGRTAMSRHGQGGGPAVLVPRQLPPETAEFVGRSAQLRRLSELADNPGRTGVVISMITGAGGVGKTALALHWAHAVAYRFVDGQLYLNLRGFGPSGSVMSPNEAVRGFLEAFGVPATRIPVSLEAQVGLYRSLLASRRVLVVLDNALDAEQVRPLLPGVPGSVVVITSRNRLSELVVVEGAHPLPTAVPPRAEARQLLAQRLGDERTDAEPDAVDEVIERCGGLPLALAIVAARGVAAPRLPLAHLAAELRDSRAVLDMVTGDDRTRDLRAVLSWSYQAQPAPVARLFRLLGLHFGVDVGVEAVASLVGLPVGEVRRALAELASANLVDEHRPGRYTLHDLMRAYAAELVTKTETQEERRAALRRLFDHYLFSSRLADQQIAPQIDHRLEPQVPGVTTVASPDHERAVTWFNTEHQALLAANERAADLGMPELVAPLTSTLESYLHMSGRLQDWVTIREFALRTTRSLGDLAGQAAAHLGLGRAHSKLGRFADAESQLREALHLYRTVGNPSALAYTHLALSHTLERGGRIPEALEHAHSALDRFVAEAHRAGTARALNAAGWCHALLDEYRRALPLCEQALVLYQELHLILGEANTWDSLGYIHHHLGDTTRAVHCYQQALGLSRRADSRFYEAETLFRLGDAYQSDGRLADAHDAWRQALEIFDLTSHPDAGRVRARLSGAVDLSVLPT